MNLFSTAERLAAIDRSAVVYHPGQCLHSMDRFAECAACGGLCPVEAIRPGKPPFFDEAQCVNCLACLVECPTGAFSASDEFQAALTCAARSEASVLELICGQNPVLDSGYPEAELGLVFRRCLAGLGKAAYLGLISMGVEAVAVRVDACEQCPLGALESRIEAQCEQANHLLAAAGMSGQILLTVEARPTKAGVERRLWDVHNPPLSRRDLFRFASQQGKVAAARALSNDHAAQERRPGREHLRTAVALTGLLKPDAQAERILENSGFGSVTVTDECTVCGSCARACPTEALLLTSSDESSFELSFKPASCIACEICTHVCSPEAITVNRAPRLGDIFNQEGEQIVVYSVKLAHCERCRTPIAAKPGVKLCPICEYRRTNPFGSMIPPAIKNKRLDR